MGDRGDRQQQLYYILPSRHGPICRTLPISSLLSINSKKREFLSLLATTFRAYVVDKINVHDGGDMLCTMDDNRLDFLDDQSFKGKIKMPSYPRRPVLIR